MFYFFIIFYSFRDSVGKKVVRSLKRKDDGITHACVDFLCALMQPMHDNFDLRQEQLNKSSLLSSKAFIDNLLDVLRSHIVSLIFVLWGSGVRGEYRPPELYMKFILFLFYRN